MFNIEKYLEKFKKNLKSNTLIIEKIVEVVERNTDIKIEKTNIELKDCVVYIKSNPLIKNKIFIYKEKILNDLSKEITDKIVNIK